MESRVFFGGGRMEAVGGLLNKIETDCAALRVVSPAYAGKCGELTAILQYVYQSVLLSARGEEREAAAIRRIAADEMRHLEILGTLICRLGAPPVFTACPPYPVSYYSASCVNYSKCTGEMLEADIQAERAAIAEYEHILENLSAGPAACVIAGILEDEREHLRLLEALRK